VQTRNTSDHVAFVDDPKGGGYQLIIIPMPTLVSNARRAEGVLEAVWYRGGRVIGYYRVVGRGGRWWSGALSYWWAFRGLPWLTDSISMSCPPSLRKLDNFRNSSSSLSADVWLEGPFVRSPDGPSFAFLSSP
jgi:hypothetical protein